MRYDANHLPEKKQLISELEGLVNVGLARKERTRRAGNLIYDFSLNDSEYLTEVLGRQREITFREAGGGTGEVLDIDPFDLGDHAYRQLVIVNPDADTSLGDNALVGGYRYQLCKDVPFVGGEPYLAMAELFDFSDEFIKQYLPRTIELGRSFITREYQARNRNGLFALDNNFDALGFAIARNTAPDEEFYLSGKMTMYPEVIDPLARDMLLYVLDKHCASDLIAPKSPVSWNASDEVLARIFVGEDFDEDFNTLSKEVKALGQFIPPLVSVYMKLSDNLHTFGTAINHGFGDVEETGILIPGSALKPDKVQNHIATYRLSSSKHE